MTASEIACLFSSFVLELAAATPQSWQPGLFKTYDARLAEVMSLYIVPFLQPRNTLSIGSLTSFAAGILAALGSRKMYLTANLVGSVTTYMPCDGA